MKYFLLLTCLVILHAPAVAQWQQLFIPTTQDIKSSSFISDEEGWIGTVNSGSPVLIFHTVDGGNYWETDTIDGASGGTTYLEFANSAVGYAVVNKAVFKTEDGGNNWVEIELPADALFEPYFFNKDTGIICGTSDELFKSFDGGITWNYYEDGLSFSSMDFLNDSTGAGSEYGGYPFKTSSGELCWEEVDEGDVFNYFFAVAYKPNGDLYYTGYHDLDHYGFIKNESGYVFNDEDESEDDVEELYDIKWFDNNVCFAVGEEGKVVYTDDGGIHWGNESITEETLNQVDGKNSVYVFGDNGVAFRATTTCFLVSDFSFAINQLTVSFSDLSPNATQWYWDFGDGTFSSEQNPVHNYALEGSYKVSHTAWNDTCGTVKIFYYLTLCGGNIFSLNIAGSIDSSFSDDGFVFYENPISNKDFASLAIQSDHKVLAVTWTYDAALIRYEFDGSFDYLFGVAGKVFLDENFSAEYIRISSDNQILVGGHDDTDVVLFRYNSEGSIDSTFGENGRVATDPSPQTTIGSGIKSFTFQPDSKIVVFGSWSYFGNHSFVFRLNTDGSFDNSFGDGGMQILPYPDLSSYTEGTVEVLSDGKILLSSTFDPDFDEEKFGLFRLLSNGVVDSTFGVNGSVVNDFGLDINARVNDMIVQNDQKILQVGISGSKLNIVRYGPDGDIDESFGTDGVISFN